jgi:YD repeat-containing protein
MQGGPKQGSLSGIFDSKGNEVQLARSSSGDLKQVTSPSGHFIRLEYNAGGQLASLMGDSGRRVQYDYDSENRLGTVRYSKSEAVSYGYDAANRLISVEDSAEGIRVVLEYKAKRGGPNNIRLIANTRTLDFDWVIDKVDSANRTATLHIDILEAQTQVARLHVRVLGDESFWSLEKMKGYAPKP